MFGVLLLILLLAFIYYGEDIFQPGTLTSANIYLKITDSCGNDVQEPLHL